MNHDEQNQILHFSTVGGGISCSSSILMLPKEIAKSIYCLSVFDEEDMYCSMASIKLTTHELNGINWGLW